MRRLIYYTGDIHGSTLEIVTFCARFQPSKAESSSAINAPIKLRDYQEEAISAWVNNDYHVGLSIDNC